MTRTAYIRKHERLCFDSFQTSRTNFSQLSVVSGGGPQFLRLRIATDNPKGSQVNIL